MHAIIIVLLLAILVDGDWDVSLIIEQDVSDAIGGESFLSQPIISSHDLKKIKKYSTMNGKVIASLYHPSVFLTNELLGLETITGDCNVDNYTDISAPLVHGDAIFSFLCVNMAADGYQVKYTLQDEFNITLASIVGNEFRVKIGSPFQIGVIRIPEIIFGGEEWDASVTVAVQDRGRNTVPDIHNGTVAVELLNDNISESLIFLRENVSTKIWASGVVSFDGAVINTVGRYRLNFTSDLDLPGRTYCITNFISVEIGDPSTIIIRDEPNKGRIFGGQAFEVQPSLIVVDKGGNELRDDSSSIVIATLYSNPMNGTLSPLSNTVGKVSKGVVQFQQLTIDKAGYGYRIIYELFLVNDNNQTAVQTNITTLGSFFDVHVGLPQRIELFGLPSPQMWSGNQPFIEQPMLTLLDAGGNIVEETSADTVNATLVPSLSRSSEIIIDTEKDDVPRVIAVQYYESHIFDEDIGFTAGHEILIKVIFSQEVNVIKHQSLNVSFPLIPSIELNVVDENAVRSKAYLRTDINTIPSRELIFLYIVSKGPISNEVNIFSKTSLEINDYLIVDTWMRNATLTLPNLNSTHCLVASKSITINNDPAYITKISTDTANGEYGAGQIIDIAIEFDRKVAVSGYPIIPIRMMSTIIIIDTSELGTSYSKSYFYIFFGKERSTSIPWDASSRFVKNALEMMSGIIGPVCVSRSLSAANIKRYRWAIRFNNRHDDIDKEIRVQKAHVRLDHEASNITVTRINTDIPLQDWVTNDGEVAMCTERNLNFIGGSGTNKLTFHYEVLPGDKVSVLNFTRQDPLIMVGGQSGSIRNSINNGTLSKINANLSTGTIDWENNITIDTSTPVIEDVSIFKSSSVTATYHVGDSIYFNVRFNKNIAVKGDAFLFLNVGGDQNWASYYSGSGTVDIVFGYIVIKNHYSPNLNIDSAKVRSKIARNEGYIRRFSDFPSSDADLNLPLHHTLNGTLIQIDGRVPRITKLFIDDNQGTLFKQRDRLLISVEFTSEVTFQSGPPVLAISIGKEYLTEASYVSGNQSKTLIFMYVIRVGDSSVSFPIMCHMLCVAAGCAHGVSNEGYITQYSSISSLDADMTLPSSSFSNKAIQQNYPIRSQSGDIYIDTSQAPLTNISNIHTQYSENATLTVGEVVRIYMTFTDVVMIRGDAPSLQLNTKSIAAYEAGAGTPTLTFRFVATVNDVIERLSWGLVNETSTPIYCKQSCIIVNENEMFVNLDVVKENHPIIDIIEPKISIDSSVPVIDSVYLQSHKMCSANCTYTAGDYIIFYVKFNLPVKVLNTLKIKTSVNDTLHGREVFAFHDALISNDTDIAFKVNIVQGLSTHGQPVEFVCAHEFCDILSSEPDSDAMVFRKATFPTIDANTTLPLHRIIQNEVNGNIVIDSTIPRVVSVECKNETGTYSPGDTLIIDVIFDYDVHVTGSPLLLLNAVSPNGYFTPALYSSGSTTKRLSFKFNVDKNHCLPRLDYVDIHSLVTDKIDIMNNEISYIRRASVHPIMRADLKLPLHGTKGALDQHSKIHLDCRIPHVMNIWSPEISSRYTTGDLILIYVEFSRDVIVTGNPMILLETGRIDRCAHFVSQPNSKTLEFHYTVKLGDRSDDLDYWTDENILRSSSSTFILNESTIMLPATHAIIKADVHLNPTFGYLSGQTKIRFQKGTAKFEGLKIGKRGLNYTIHFKYYSASVQCIFEVSAPITIRESAEYHVYGDEKYREVGDSFGGSVAISGNLIAIGAPRKRNPSSEVQVVTIKSDTKKAQNEIQLIETGVNADEATKQIQRFTTSGAKNSTLSGNFSLGYIDNQSYIYAAPILIPSNAIPEQMEILISARFPNLGPLKVSRSKNMDCECVNGWTWALTFLDASNGVQLLQTDGKNLVGEDAEISKSIMIQETAMIKGTFQLKNPYNGAISREISYRATAFELKTVIEGDLGLFTKLISVTNTDDRDIPQLGRKWVITFSHYYGAYGIDVNVPNLEVHTSRLKGVNAVVWTHVGFEGRSVLNGEFAMSFRNSGFSNFLPFNASSDQMKDALESLDSINIVNVSPRKRMPLDLPISGFSWTITFHSVNKFDAANGWRYDIGGQSTKGNLPPLEITCHLTGWNAQSIVDYEFGAGEEDTQAQWMAKSMGTDGINSGQVVVYNNNNEQWDVDGLLQASDGKQEDYFGSSISLYSDHMAIGAPMKEVYGVFEHQTIKCHKKAVGGTFRVTLRGQHSNPIPYNATQNDMKSAILGFYGTTNKIHIMSAFVIKGSKNWYDESMGFCTHNGNNVTVTLLTPDGSGLSTKDKINGNIESLEIDSSELVGGDIHVIESRKGSRSLSGKGNLNDSILTLGKRCGAIYIYYRSKDCEFCPSLWKERIKLTPLNSLDLTQNSAKFGWSTAVGGTNESKNLTLIVGSPGFRNSTGKVYAFTGSINDWTFMNSFTSSLWNDDVYGANFGYSVALNGDTLLIGSPGHNSDRGAVYVFLRYKNNMGFLASQSIYGPIGLKNGDKFGFSVALSGNRAVICAPYHDDFVQSGTINSDTDQIKDNVGACYIYERPSVFEPFQVVEKLQPTNLEKNNRFGQSVAMAGNKIVVGQVEQYRGTIKAISKAIRGKAHIFTLNNSVWTELAYLYPHFPQQHDLYGTSVAMNNNVAVIGAPNRQLLNIKSGCASIINLTFSNFHFENSISYVKEGDSIVIPLKRSNNDNNEIIGYKSLDRNVEPFLQNYIQELFQLDQPSNTYPIKSGVDILYSNTAYGSHYNHGCSKDQSNCKWSNGIYDYDARNDYRTIDGVKRFQHGISQDSILLQTTNDEIHEYPYENLTISVSLPGMFASSKGQLNAHVTIFDDDDGSIDNKTFFQKLFSNVTTVKSYQLEAAIDFLPDVAVVGSSMFDRLFSDNNIAYTGIAMVFMISGGKWYQTALLSPNLDAVDGKKSLFGQSVSISKMNKNELTVIIGVPLQIKAYIFTYDFSTYQWTEESCLEPFNETESVTPEHNFAARGTVEINGDIVFIGTPGLETVYVYRRLLDILSRGSWQPWGKLHSDDYDYDVYNNYFKTQHVHKQLFGHAVESSGRLLLVASIFADYGNRGDSNSRESYDTNGKHNRGSGKGKVYVFHSRPFIAKVSIIAKGDIHTCNYKLDFQIFEAINVQSTLIPCSGNSSVVQDSLRSLLYIGEVDVKFHRFYNHLTGEYHIEWCIVFVRLFHNRVKIMPLYRNNDSCTDCDWISGFNNTFIEPRIELDLVSTVGEFSQEWVLQGDDVESGDKFGYSIDIDGHEAIVGAIHSSANTRSTWDFETGSLIGWVATGNAFDYQPVFGDNSKRRMVYNGFGKPASKMSGYPQSASIQGRYYIGTYEKRPGNSTNYLHPNTLYSEGTIQGDDPIGTLTSDSFIILGGAISFLVGGGCDHLNEYIELLVDGFVTMRATGFCDERMERTTWSVSHFKFRSAQIRIVDTAHGDWGHINVDDITFSWKSVGNNSGCSNIGGALKSKNSQSKQHYSGQEETALSGAAYVFVRNCTVVVDWVLAQQGTGCIWKQDQRLVPSDKRSKNLFGSSVSINSSRGIATVGSKNAPLYGIHKEMLSLYPHTLPPIKFPLKQHLEPLMKAGITLSPTAGNLRVSNYALVEQNYNSSFLSEKFHEKGGAVYVFVKSKTEYASDGLISRAPFWKSFEHAKIAPPDLRGNSFFGENVKIDGDTAFATATGEQGRAAFFFDLKWHQFRFSQVEYQILEGDQEKVTINILRDIDDHDFSTNTATSIGYATSDLSALGVGNEVANECLKRSIENRTGCGDYEHTSGILTFEPGIMSASFEIRIIDDFCWERHMKYVQLNLHIPGGVLIQGERFRAQLKIDDDDWLNKNTTKVCEES